MQALAEQLGIARHLECFRAQRVGSHQPRMLVDRCWDLPGVNARYVDFTERWQTDLDRCTVGVSSSDVVAEECFTLRFNLIHEFRAFPLEDPYLPRTLLPERWHGGATLPGIARSARGTGRPVCRRHLGRRAFDSRGTFVYLPRLTTLI